MAEVKSLSSLINENSTKVKLVKVIRIFFNLHIKLLGHRKGVLHNMGGIANGTEVFPQRKFHM